MYEMKLHDIGEGMTEGEVVQLLVQVGDSIELDQPVIEIQTDKVCAELPSPVAGKIIEILVQVGDMVSVGSTIMKIDEETALLESIESIKSNHQYPDLNDNQQLDQNSVQRSNHHPIDRLKKVRNVMAAPYTRKIAREYRIQIESITGTGPNGRITIDDVEQYAHNLHSQGTQHEVATTQEAVQATHPFIESHSYRDTERKSAQPRILPGQSIPFTGRRKQIAHKMTQSMFTIPHVTHFDKIDMSLLIELKEQYQLQNDRSRGARIDDDSIEERISIMAFIMKAIAISLKEFPIFNAKLHEDRGEIYLEPHINIGVAVNTEEGLIVPVIHKAEELSIFELNQQMKRLTKKAQQNQLQTSELRGGTFTVSNVGPIGGMFATPIINHPEVALLAFHQLEDMPVVRHKEIVIRSMLNFSMSFDHRIADGVTAVQFTNRMKQLLESPMHLLTKLA